MVSGALYATVVASLAITAQAIADVAVASSITAGVPTTVTYSDAGSGACKVYLAARVPEHPEGPSCMQNNLAICSESLTSAKAISSIPLHAHLQESTSPSLPLSDRQSITTMPLAWSLLVPRFHTPRNLISSAAPLIFPTMNCISEARRSGTLLSSLARHTIVRGNVPRLAIRLISTMMAPLRQ